MAGALAGLVDKGLVAPDWAEALAPVDEHIAAMRRFLRDEDVAGRGYQPAADRVFRAFQRPLADVRVLVVGQDPYPNPAHPIGLSFAVERHVWPLPPSLLKLPELASKNDEEKGELLSKKIAFPVLHIMGEQDEWKWAGEALVSGHYEIGEGKSVVENWDMGHHYPARPEESERMNDWLVEQLRVLDGAKETSS